MLGKLRVDAPVARFVRVGQRAARHGSADSQVVELGGLRTQAGRDVAQALAISQLRERHAAKLIRATEIADTMIAVVTLDDTTEGLPRKMIHQLGEHQFAGMHAPHLCLKGPWVHAFRRSNRRHVENDSLLQPISDLRKPHCKLTGHVVMNTVPQSMTPCCNAN
jgi:hypothetical protein